MNEILTSTSLSEPSTVTRCHEKNLFNKQCQQGKQRVLFIIFCQYSHKPKTSILGIEFLEALTGGTTIRTHDISYTRHLVHTTSRTKTKTRHFVQKRNQTFRAIYIIQLIIIT